MGGACFDQLHRHFGTKAAIGEHDIGGGGAADLSRGGGAGRACPGVPLLQARAAAGNGAVPPARTRGRAARQRAKEWGEAATAYVLAFEPATAAGGGRCDALIDAREAWTDDALTACRALTAAGAAPPDSAPAAERVRQAGRDPMRWALAPAAPGEGRAQALS